MIDLENLPGGKVRHAVACDFSGGEKLRLLPQGDLLAKYVEAAAIPS